MNEGKRFPKASVFFAGNILCNVIISIVFTILILLVNGENIQVGATVMSLVEACARSIVIWLPLVIVLCMKQRNILLMLALALFPVSSVFAIVEALMDYLRAGESWEIPLITVMTQAVFKGWAALGFVLMILLVILARNVQPGEKHYTRFLWFVPGILWVLRAIVEYGLFGITLLAELPHMSFEEWVLQLLPYLINTSSDAIGTGIITIGLLLLGHWVVNPWKKQVVVETEEIQEYVAEENCE